MKWPILQTGSNIIYRTKICTQIYNPVYNEIFVAYFAHRYNLLHCRYATITDDWCRHISCVLCGHLKRHRAEMNFWNIRRTTIRYHWNSKRQSDRFDKVICNLSLAGVSFLVPHINPMSLRAVDASAKRPAHLLTTLTLHHTFTVPFQAQNSPVPQIFSTIVC